MYNVIVIEQAKAARAAELVSATEFTCRFTWQGKSFTRFLTMYKSTSRPR